MNKLYGMFNPFTRKSYNYMTRDEKEDRLLQALEMSLDDKCPPEREDYLCQASEDESTDSETCKACWLCWATKNYRDGR